MLTGDLRNKVDQVWNAFWSGGIAKPPTAAPWLHWMRRLPRCSSGRLRGSCKVCPTNLFTTPHLC
ncbi:hypothetical protein LJR074_000066 [Acidovorax sp. LjRoot74]|uniref:hypothetical protein n=1 Tax=Acidovorax sp. LjRoot74 TaxID=3342337 RepID=UPI003ECFE49D